MTPSYVSFKAIQLLSETFFSKIKNKKLIWDRNIKMGHPVYLYIFYCNLIKIEFDFITVQTDTSFPI